LSRLLAVVVCASFLAAVTPAVAQHVHPPATPAGPAARADAGHDQLMAEPNRTFTFFRSNLDAALGRDRPRRPSAFATRSRASSRPMRRSPTSACWARRPPSRSEGARARSQRSSERGCGPGSSSPLPTGCRALA
jgi:hypothetical protein